MQRQNPMAWNVGNRIRFPSFVNTPSRIHNHHRLAFHPVLVPPPIHTTIYRSLRPRLWFHSSPPLSSMSTRAESRATQSQQSESSKTVRVVIKGRVQGVCYRNWTVQNANQLGIKGWVRNRRDGSVEAVFSGPIEDVDEMYQRCRRGPPAAIVTGLEAFPSSVEEPGTCFEYRSTV